MTKKSSPIVLAVLLSFIGLLFKSISADIAYAQGSLSITNITQSAASLPQYEKFEVTFDVNGTVAKNLQLPYDPQTDVPSLVPKIGITVDGLFLSAGQTDWSTATVVPAFLYQPVLVDRTIGVSDSEWFYPSGKAVWKIRFTPKTTGTFRYKIRVQDNSNYPAWLESGERSVSVSGANAGNHGFVKVSARDPRYFEFSDGTPFIGVGYNDADSPGSTAVERVAESNFATKNASRVNFDRIWMDMQVIFSRGTHGWDPWRGADSLRTTTEKFEGHDFSVKLSGNSIEQYMDGSQYLTSAIESGKTYVVKVTAKITSGSSSGLTLNVKGSSVNFWTEAASYANGWKTYQAKFTNTGSRNIYWSSAPLRLSAASGTTVYIDEVYMGEDLGSGQVGPNVIFKGGMNYQLYYDAISSADWDKIIEHAEKYGVYLKLVIEDKEDLILWSYNTTTGVLDFSTQRWDNFHGWRNTKVRRLQEYFWRYLAARWGYSTAIHSWELVNEDDPGSGAHFDQTDHMAEYMHSIGQGHLASTSFWAEFRPGEFWCKSQYSDVDYADVHAYNSSGWIKDALLENDAAYMHILYNGETRSMMNSAGCNKPIVRGEVGVDRLNSQQEFAELSNDTNGVWLHNFTWAMLHPGGMYELYWWVKNIKGGTGPDGSSANGKQEVYKPYMDFMDGVNGVDRIPINNGLYQDAAPTLSNSGMRAVGQKDNKGRQADHAHVWVQNKNHTWRNVVNGGGTGNVAGTVKISGFKPSVSFPVEYWKFNMTGQLTKSASSVTSDSGGVVAINLDSLSNTSDVGIKIGDYIDLPVPVTSTPTPRTTNSPTPPGGSNPADADGNGIVNESDYGIWKTYYGTPQSGASKGDFNGNGIVDGFDYVIWVNYYAP